MRRLSLLAEEIVDTIKAKDYEAGTEFFRNDKVMVEFLLDFDGEYEEETNSSTFRTSIVKTKATVYGPTGKVLPRVTKLLNIELYGA